MPLPRPARVLALAAALLLLALPARAQTSSDWQQVRYDMFVELDPATHGMTGVQELRYTNTSPDTLREVFYHLYFNAFDPSSMMAERNRELPDPDGRVVPRIFELGPDEVGFHRVGSLEQDGRALTDIEVTDTILRARLATPLAPGQTTTLRMTYASQVPLQTRRSGRDSREGIAYSMSQWYPKLAAYDVSGWHADPYVGREFYAPFGTFDVRITIPADHVLGATGLLQNPDEIGHGYQSDTTRVYSYDPEEKKTWRFLAENVHDFAWVADPDYIHDVIPDTLGGKPVTYHVLYQPDVAEVWQNQRRWLPTLMGCFSDRLGTYAYPQMTVAQAGDGGMEYPMINFNTGRRSPRSLLGVTSHELAHEWFYATVGFDEAAQAWPDEGFTSFASTNAMACLGGRAEGNQGRSVQSLVLSHELGFGERLSTRSDWFERNGAYGTAAYSGGQALLHMLGDVIGDSLRDEFLRELVRRYRFRHATPALMQRLAEEVSGVQLGWFFEQVTNGDLDLDYEIGGLWSRYRGEGYLTRARIEREGRMVMPQTVRFDLEDGTTYDVVVPLGIMQGAKPMPDSLGMVAAPWLWTSPEYHLEVMLPARAVRATLDPGARQPDRDRLDNSTGSPVRASFLQPARPNWTNYSVGWRPLATYAAGYGPGFGLRAEGGYWLGQHDAKAMVTVWPERFDGEAPEFEEFRNQPGFPNAPDYAEEAGAKDASWFEAIDYEVAYRSSLGRRSPGTSVGISSRKHIGTLHSRAFVRHAFGPAPGIGDTRGVLTLSIEMVTTPWARAFSNDLERDYFANTHNLRRANDLTATLRYDAGGRRGDLSIALDLGGRIGQRLDDNLYVGRFDRLSSGTQLTITLDRRATFGPLRARAGLMGGISSRNIATYRAFRLGQPSTLNTWKHDAARVAIAAADESYKFSANPTDPRRASVEFPLLYAVSQYGPMGYAVDDDNYQQRGLFRFGSRILAGSLELGSAPLMEALPLTAYAFSGAAYLPSFSNGLNAAQNSKPFFDAEHFFADAGIGARLVVGDIPKLRRWTAQSDILSDLSLVFKAPLYVYQRGYEVRTSTNTVAEVKSDALAFRYLIGIEVRP